MLGDKTSITRHIRKRHSVSSETEVSGLKEPVQNNYDEYKDGEKTRSISMVPKPFLFEVFVVKSAQAVTLSIIVLMCVTINARTALKVTDVGLNCIIRVKEPH